VFAALLTTATVFLKEKVLMILTGNWVSLSRLANRDVDYLDVLFRLLLVDLGIFDFMNSVESLISPSKYGMLPVQPRSLLSSNEKLRAVGIWTSIGHANSVWLVVS
jgi:hypothetical protein